jgi:inner membrane protein
MRRVDPLTHTLVGANLASTRLGRASRLAPAALIIGANFPDLDALTYVFASSDFSLGVRRGWTHGLLALLVLPFVLTALLLLWGRFRRAADDAPPLRPYRLLGLSALAILTHPFLDWLNTYGMRWLMPFDGRWSYGDSVYIMDPWLWLLLAVPWMLARRPRPGLIVLWAVIASLLLFAVSSRSLQHAAMVGAISLIPFLALLWRPRGDPLAARQRWGTIAVAAGSIYIAGMLVLQAATVREVERLLSGSGGGGELLMAGPMPANPLKWDIVYGEDDRYRFATFDWRGELVIDPHSVPRATREGIWQTVKDHPDVWGFADWARFPWIETRTTSDGLEVHLRDARYQRRAGSGFGSAVVVLPEAAAGE